MYTKDDLDTKLSLTPQMLFAAFARRSSAEQRFSELFGAIASTFRMFEPDQPTDFT